MKVIDFRIWSNICSRLLYCEFVGFEVLSDVHAQCFLIRICFGVRIIGATDVDKHLCEQITKILWIWNLVVNSMQREGAARQSSKVVSGWILCLSRHSEWRYKATLSRQWCWRDKPILSARLRALVPALLHWKMQLKFEIKIGNL